MLQCKSDLISGFIDKTKRLYCSSSSCDYVCWDNPVPVVAGIVQRDNKIILVRSKGWLEGFYGLVAGFLEKGETPEDGIMREVKEELGLETKNFNFIGYYSFFGKNQLILAFHVKAQGEIELCKDELDGYKLISPEKLKPWEMGTGPAVRDWLNSRNP